MTVRPHSTAWRTVIGAVLSVGFFWLAARGVSWSAVGEAFASAHYGLVTLAAGCVISSTALRAWCWRCLLGHAGSSIGFTQTWGILLVGQAVNIGVPARAGDVARLYLIGAAGRLPMAGAFTTLIVEKFFDLTTLLLILVPISALIDLPPALDATRRGFVVVAVVLPLVVMILAWRGETLIRVLKRHGHGAPNGWILRLVSHGDTVLQSLTVVRRGRFLVLLQVGYLGTWLSLAGANYAVLRSLGVAAPLVAALVVLVVLQLGTAVPSTPGKIGVFQYLCVLALAPFGVPRDHALTYSVLLHVVTYGGVIVLGGVWLWSAVWPSAKDGAHEARPRSAQHRVD